VDDVAALRSATVRTGGTTILGPIDLTVGRGEHWVFLGPNGGGKTTLLSLLGARRQPSSGTAVVLGRRLGRTDVRNLRTRIGHVSQSISDVLRLTQSVENVVLTGKASNLETWFQELDAAERSAARRLLDDVGCLDLAERALSTCSMGERQRVLIARALFGDPELLLLDEPAAGLDLPAREQLVAAMTAAGRRPGGPATVLATHHVEEIPSTVTHAGLVRGGMLASCGRIELVLRDAELSACYGLPIAVERRHGRWWARAR
jgi:iron complex transport system ATP-binding protein